MGVVDRSFDHPMKPEEKASIPFAGGVANMGYQCGMLWGAALAAGAQAYRLHGPGAKAQAEAILASQNLVKAFRAQAKNEINCMEISHLNLQGDVEIKAILKFFLKGGPVGCFRMAARYAREAYSEIESSLPADNIEAPASPVSCASLLAKELGASEMHTAMVAGFAGGIGLSGGACGVLGAAIWLKGLNNSDGLQLDGLSYSGTWVNDKIEQFLESSDYEFECSEIVGRKFENLDDHAKHISSGGCSKIIEALAA